jgi:hypothetical protein
MFWISRLLRLLFKLQVSLTACVYSLTICWGWRSLSWLSSFETGLVWTNGISLIKLTYRTFHDFVALLFSKLFWYFECSDIFVLHDVMLIFLSAFSSYPVKHRHILSHWPHTNTHEPPANSQILTCNIYAHYHQDLKSLFKFIDLKHPKIPSPRSESTL